MPGDAVDLGAVDEDLLLGRLEAQDVGDVVRGHGVPVRLEGDKPFGVADPQGHFRGIVGMARQGLELLLRRSSSRGGFPVVRWRCRSAFSLSHHRAVARRSSRSSNSLPPRRLHSIYLKGASIFPFVSGRPGRHAMGLQW